MLVPPYLEEASALDLAPRVLVNQSLVLRCPVRGQPLPSVHWFRERGDQQKQQQELAPIDQRLLVTDEADKTRTNLRLVQFLLV